MRFGSRGFHVLLTALALIVPAGTTSSCPEECRCKQGSLVGVGSVYEVDCKERELNEVPDLSSLSVITDPIYLILKKNEINFVSSVDFPAGVNIVSIDLEGNPDMTIADDAFMNYASTLKILNLDAIGYSFGETLKMVSPLGILEELSISHNNRQGYVTDSVDKVTVTLFEGQVTRSLKKLKMTHCGIRDMAANTLDKLVALQELDLSNNWMTRIPSVVKHLGELQKLHMFRCHIDIVEDYTFLGLNNLEVLELTTNTLHTIEPYAFKGLENSLKKLKLERCHLQEIPSPALKNLKALEYLDLSQNSFVSAPASAFVGQYCLKTLLVSAVNMAFEDETFSGQSECIEELTIKQMQLNSVPQAALSQLEKLRSLSLENNNLTVLPERAFAGIKAKRINLANNPLTTIEQGAFDGLPPLLDISLKNTLISDIDFLLDYPDDAIETVSLDNARLECRCSMKSSLNATTNIFIYGSCDKGGQEMPLSSSRLEGILDLACAEEAARANQAVGMQMNLAFTVTAALTTLLMPAALDLSFPSERRSHL